MITHGPYFILFPYKKEIPSTKDGLERRRMRGKSCFRFFVSLRSGILFFLALTCGCQSSIPYKNQEVEFFKERKIGVELRFQTSYGEQNAYYVFPRKADIKTPGQLVIVYPGVGDLALEWLDFVSHSPQEDAGFLLIEYPGRGKNRGFFRIPKLEESSRGGLRALSDYLGVPPDELTRNIAFLGHSFGCGAALQFASEMPPKKIVLIAPFKIFKQFAFRTIGPLAWFLPSWMDNCETVKKLCRLPNSPAIAIIHGSADETIPVTMGRNLAQCAPLCITFREIDKAGHADILRTEQRLIMDTLLGSP